MLLLFRGAEVGNNDDDNLRGGDSGTCPPVPSFPPRDADSGPEPSASGFGSVEMDGDFGNDDTKLGDPDCPVVGGTNRTAVPWALFSVVSAISCVTAIWSARFWEPSPAHLGIVTWSGSLGEASKSSSLLVSAISFDAVRA